MKKILTLSVATMLFVSAAPAFALTGVSLTLANIGQSNNNTSQFGIAVCNQGTMNLSSPQQISVTANGTTFLASTANSINAGNCAYSYIPYNNFSMTPGQTYSITAQLGSGSASTYQLTVPQNGQGTVLGASTMSNAVRMQLLAQLASMENLLAQLLARAQALGM
jgi:hypothetical protein